MLIHTEQVGNQWIKVYCKNCNVNAASFQSSSNEETAQWFNFRIEQGMALISQQTLVRLYFYKILNFDQNQQGIIDAKENPYYSPAFGIILQPQNESKGLTSSKAQSLMEVLEIKLHNFLSTRQAQIETKLSMIEN